MKKHPLTAADKALVKTAIEVAKKKALLLWGEKGTPKVAAAVRLDDGHVITSVNLRLKPSNLSTCAEPVAISEAARQPDRKIKSLVAVYHEPGTEPKVVPPCGQCREILIGYAPDAMVILREPGKKKLFRVKVADLLPLKFADYWHHKELL
jgi:cytidine deaminase